MTIVKSDGCVEFRFFRPGVAGIEVAGNFKSLPDGRLAMTSQGDGWWVASAQLDAGEYRFRYVADGVWYTDFASHGVELFRDWWNSVLVVPAYKAPAATPTEIRIAA
jgi:hypothetical protein